MSFTYFLHCSLVYEGSTPCNYFKFLDYSADRILVRKLGGGCIFIHHYLLQWLVKSYY